MSSETKKKIWLCSDGIRTDRHEADTHDEAAFQFTLNGTYEVKCCTIYPEIMVWPEDEEQGGPGTQAVMVRIDPDTPDCPGQVRHGWRKPKDGGIYPREEGVVIVSVCCHCSTELSLTTHDKSRGIKSVPVLRYKKPETKVA